MIRTFVALAVVVAAAAGSAAPVWAQEQVGVIGHWAKVAPESAEAVRDAVAAALGGGAVADPFARARGGIDAGATPAPRLEGFAGAARLMDEGWRAYQKVQKSYARSRLIEARRVAEEVLDLEGGRELYAEVSLRLGLVLFDGGEMAEAGDLFRLARRLDPAREIGTSEFHPDVVKAIETAAAAAAPVHRVAIEVGLEGGGGGGAAVEIDGKALGSAPVTVEIDAGQHVLVVRRPGHVPRGQAILVPAGDGAPVRVTLERDPGAAAVLAGEGALAVERSEGDARVALDGLLLWGELDAVVMAAAVWRRGQPALLGQLCESPGGAPLRCTQVEEIGFPAGALAAGARELVARLRKGRGGRSFAPYLLTDRRLVDGEKAPGTGPINGNGGGKGGWIRNPYLWVGVGAVALAAGAWALFGGEDTVTPVIGSEPCMWTSTCATASPPPRR